jgi:hypothetical protein
MARLLFRACLRRASCFRYGPFGTLNIMRTALSMGSAGVLPGTFGAGAGFILVSSYNGFG